MRFLNIMEVNIFKYLNLYLNLRTVLGYGGTKLFLQMKIVLFN